MDAKASVRGPLAWAWNDRKRQRQSNEFNADSYNEPNKKFKCEPCHVYFTEHKSLLRHQRENKKHRLPQFDPSSDILCDVCQKSFARAHDLERHRKEQHLDGKMSCPKCGKEFGPILLTRTLLALNAVDIMIA